MKYTYSGVKMKFLLSVKSNTPDSQLDAHFGRAAWFVILDTETQLISFLENDGGKQSSGAGVAAAQYAVDQNAQAVVSGHFGPHAVQVLASAGIKMFLLDDTCQTIEDVRKAMQQGSLKEQES
jgi:predicted Fe-Mo cluster-binding NifX family protein